MRDGDITISPALPEHAPAIYALSDATHAVHRKRLPHVFGPDNDYQHKLLDAAFEPETIQTTTLSCALLVAEREEHFLGYVLVIWDTFGVESLIADIAVISAARRQGVASALLAALQDPMHAERWGSLKADVWHGNQSSHHLFAKAGFLAERTEYRFGTPPPLLKVEDEQPKSVDSRWWVLTLLLLGAALWAYLTR